MDLLPGGTRVPLIAQNLRGTGGPTAGPDGNVLFTEQQASVITNIDANNNRTTFLENMNGSNGLNFDPKWRLIGTQPDKAVIAVLSPAYSRMGCYAWAPAAIKSFTVSRGLTTGHSRRASYHEARTVRMSSVVFASMNA